MLGGVIGAAESGGSRAPVRAARFAAGLSVLVPFIAALLYVRSYGVDVFYADEWDFVTLLKRLARGTLGAADLLAHHNEHVYLFPWGVMLLLGGLTGYDTVPLMYLVVACLLATSLAVYLAFARSVGRPPVALLLFVPVPLLLFSFRQFENMLWGNQITFALAQTFSVLALCLLSAAGDGPRRKLTFPAAALCAAIASCSAAPGLLAWPAGLLLLACRREGRARTGAWVLLGAAVWGGYLVGYGGPGASQQPFFALGHPVAGAEYLLTLSGGSLFWREGAALAAGALLGLLAAVALSLVVVLRRAGENAFWISLGTFSLLSLALITAGRSGLGEVVFAQAVLSRYAAFSIPGVVALYCLFANLALNARSRAAAAMLGVLLLVVVASAVYSYPRGMEAGRETEDSRRQSARILAAHKTEPLAAFTIFGHDPRRVQRYARFLDRRDYGIFAEGAEAKSDVRRGPRDTVAPPRRVRPGPRGVPEDRLASPAENQAPARPVDRKTGSPARLSRRRVGSALGCQPPDAPSTSGAEVSLGVATTFDHLSAMDASCPGPSADGELCRWSSSGRFASGVRVEVCGRSPGSGQVK